MKWIDKNVDLGLLILRIGVGGLMFLHGFHKIFNGIGMIEGQVTGMGLPAFFAYGVYIGEVVAPLLILLGLGTRAASAILAVNCVVAMLMVHTKDIFSLTPQGGWGVELLGLYLFGAIALMCTGGGKYAVSHKRIWD